MPNHVTHRVVVTGPISEIARFTELCIRNEEFDFESLTPMPEILGQVISPVRRGENGRIMLNPDGELLTKGVEANEEQQAVLDKLTHTDWYSWSIHNWGTKWNSYSYSLISSVPERFEFLFDTAWSPPEPIFHRLADEFPELAFEIAFFDEGWNYAGTASIKDGLASVNSTDATDELYERVYGRPPERDDEDEEMVD